MTTQYHSIAFFQSSHGLPPQNTLLCSTTHEMNNRSASSSVLRGTPHHTSPKERGQASSAPQLANTKTEYPTSPREMNAVLHEFAGAQRYSGIAPCYFARMHTLDTQDRKQTRSSDTSKSKHKQSSPARTHKKHQRISHRYTTSTEAQLTQWLRDSVFHDEHKTRRGGCSVSSLMRSTNAR